jgi:hypothetical protein
MLIALGHDASLPLATPILTFAFLVPMIAQATAEALSGRSSAQHAER